MKPMQSNNNLPHNQRVIVWIRTRPPMTESSPLIALDLDNNACVNQFILKALYILFIKAMFVCFLFVFCKNL